MTSLIPENKRRAFDALVGVQSVLNLIHGILNDTDDPLILQLIEHKLMQAGGQNGMACIITSFAELFGNPDMKSILETEISLAKWQLLMKEQPSAKEMGNHARATV